MERALWAVDVPEEAERIAKPRLFQRVLIGGRETYEACRREARRVRKRGATAIMAPAAGIKAGRAGGQVVRGPNLVDAPAQDGQTLAIFGPRPELRGWVCVESGHPSARVLALVNHF